MLYLLEWDESKLVISYPISRISKFWFVNSCGCLYNITGVIVNFRAVKLIEVNKANRTPNIKKKNSKILLEKTLKLLLENPAYV
jgi:hypothetical protein